MTEVTDIADSLLAQQRNAKMMAAGSIDEDPDKASRAMELGRETGVEPGVVYGDVENYERLHKAKLTSELLDGNPHLNEYINSHPMAAKISNGDFGQLDAVSAAVLKAFQVNTVAALTKVAKAYKDAGIGVYEDFTSMRRPIQPDDGFIKGVLEDVKYLPAGAGKAFSAALGAFGLPFAPIMDVATEVGALPIVGALKGIGAITGKPIPLSDEDLLQKVKSEVSIAAWAYGKPHPKAVSAAMAAKPFIEAGQSPPVGIHPEIDKLHSEQAKLDVKNLDEALQESVASASRERSPELFASFIRQHTKARIGVSSEAVRKLYGDKEPTPEDGVLGWVPDIVSQLRTAEAIGGDIEIPRADWLARVDPKVAKELHDHTRVWSDGMTLEEVKGLTETQAHFAEGEEKKFYQERPANENIPIEERLPEPLSREERDWQNYGKHLTPNEVLSSEIVWSAADRAAETGKGRAEGFADYANMIWQRMGANRYITPELARRYMAVEEAKAKGIKAVETEPRALFAEPIGPVDAMRLHASLDPMLQGKLKLERLKRGKVAAAGEGGFHDFQFVNEEGKPVGVINLSEQKGGKELYVEWIGGGTGFGPQSFGFSLMRGLIRQLRDEFPNAEALTGFRVSGAREKAGTFDKQIPGARLGMQYGDTLRINLRNPSEGEVLAFGEAMGAGWESVGPGPKGESIIPTGAKAGAPAIAGAKSFQPIVEFPAREALTHVDIESLTGVPRALAEFFGDRLNKLAGDVPVKVLRDEDMKALALAAGHPTGNVGGLHRIFPSGEREITLPESIANGSRGQGIATQVVIHEVAHAATVRAMYTDRMLRGSIRKMMDEATEFLKEVDPKSLDAHKYAFGNEYEFMAEAFANPRFQEVLAITPMSAALAERLGVSKTGSVWDAVRHIVRNLIEKLVGIRPPDTILDGIFKVGQMIEERGQAGPAKVAAHAAEQPELPGTRRLEDTEAFAKAAAIGMTREQYARYLKLIEKRNQEDLAQVAKRVYEDEKRRQTKEWKENEAKVGEEARSEVEARPDIQADQFFRSGTLYGEKLAERPRLDASKLTEEQKALLPREYFKDGGINPDDTAGLFGYQSGDALIDRLSQLVADRAQTGMQPKEYLDALVKSETEQRMQKQFGDLQKNILDEAKEHILSQTQIDLLHEEMLALGTKHKGQIAISKEDVKRWVKQEFDQTKIGSIDGDKYIAAAGRAGRDAEMALLKDKPGEAFKAKQQQYLGVLMAQEAKRLERERGQFDRTAKQMSKREVPSVSQEYTNFVHDILGRVGQVVRRSVQDLQESIAAGAQTSLQEFVNYKQGHDLREVPVADFLFDPAFRKRLEELTAEEFRAVHDSVKTLVKNGRDELKIEKAGAEADLAEVRGQMIQMLESLPEKKIDVTKSARRGVGHVVKTVWASLLQMESVFNRWDRGDPNGVFTQYVMRPLAEAANYVNKLEKQYSRELRAIADKADLSKRVDNDRFRSPLNGELMVFSRKNLRAILQNVGNPGNLKKLAKGYKLTEEQVMEWVNKNATKEDWGWAQAQGDIFARIKQTSDVMYRQMSGVAAENIEIVPIRTPHGTYPGWYHPVVYDPRFEGTSKKLMGGDALEGEGYFRATTPRGYTQKRTGYIAPVSLDLDMTPSRMKSMLHDIAFRQAVVQASKIFYDQSVRNAVTKHYGLTYKDMLVPYLKDVANSANFRSDAQAVGASISEWIRQNIIGTLIGFNPGTVMKHGPTAAINSVTEVGAVNFLRALKDLTQVSEETGERNWTFAMNTSEELQRRHRNYVETLRGAQEEVLGENTFRNTMIKIGATPVAVSDLLSAVPTWTAKYRTEMLEHGIHGDAVFAADRAVRRAHGSSVITNRPAAMRGGQMAQWLTSLYGFFSHMLNRQFEMGWRMKEGIEGLKAGDREEFMKQAKIVTPMFFSYIIVPALIEELVTPLSNDQHESWGKWSAMALAKGVSSSWPIVRDLADFALSGWRREPSVGLFSTTAKTVGDITRDVGRGREAFNEQHAGQSLQHFFTAFGAMTGLTNAQEGKWARFMYNLHTGQERPKGFKAWWRGFRTGTSVERK